MISITGQGKAIIYMYYIGVYNYGGWGKGGAYVTQPFPYMESRLHRLCTIEVTIVDIDGFYPSTLLPVFSQGEKLRIPRVVVKHWILDM